MIEAFHSNWTAPFFTVYNGEYFIEDFEILTTILSALKWREFNGNIKMITDERGAEYYKSLNIDTIWNKGINVILDKLISKEIDANIFWAAGKIFALQSENTPCAMIDTDFIVWNNINDILHDKEVCTIHSEDITDIYPFKNTFIMKDKYTFDSEWDWRIKPQNTAFTYIANRGFKDYYTNSAIEFMKNLKVGDNRIVNMVFAEQRLISMCSKKMNINIHEIFSLNELSRERQTLFTHIWGYKEVLRTNKNERCNFCVRCIRRILKDYPYFEDKIANMDMLKEYYRIAKEL